jgi:hypothetical protein
MACSSAVLGLYFSISESYLSNLADGRVPDDLCTMAAGGWMPRDTGQWGAQDLAALLGRHGVGY